MLNNEWYVSVVTFCWESEDKDVLSLYGFFGLRNLGKSAHFFLPDFLI